VKGKGMNEIAFVFGLTVQLAYSPAIFKYVLHENVDVSSEQILAWALGGCVIAASIVFA
jgi:hypothetical protein